MARWRWRTYRPASAAGGVDDAERIRDGVEGRIVLGRGHRHDEFPLLEARLESQERAAVPLHVDGLVKDSRVVAGVEAHGEPTGAALSGHDMARQGAIALQLTARAAGVETAPGRTRELERVGRLARSDDG